jgi:hypothetical protein
MRILLPSKNAPPVGGAYKIQYTHCRTTQAALFNIITRQSSNCNKNDDIATFMTKTRNDSVGGVAKKRHLKKICKIALAIFLGLCIIVLEHLFCFKN